MSRKDEYPKYPCYICGKPVGNKSDPEIGGTGVRATWGSDIWHVVHWGRCEHYFYRFHHWDGEKTLEEVHAITKRRYFDSIIYFDWLI